MFIELQSKYRCVNCYRLRCLKVNDHEKIVKENPSKS